VRTTRSRPRSRRRRRWTRASRSPWPTTCFVSSSCRVTPCSRPRPASPSRCASSRASPPPRSRGRTSCPRPRSRSGSCARRRRCRPRVCPSRCRRAASSPSASAQCVRCSTSCSTRATPPPEASDGRGPSSARRRSGSRASSARTCPTTPRRTACSRSSSSRPRACGRGTTPGAAPSSWPIRTVHGRRDRRRRTGRALHPQEARRRRPRVRDALLPRRGQGRPERARHGRGLLRQADHQAHRLLETYMAAHVAPRGFGVPSWPFPVWLKDKAWVAAQIEKAPQGVPATAPRMSSSEHHYSHAASAFFPSPFERPRSSPSTASASGRRRAGAWARATQIELLLEQRFPHSPRPALLGLHLLHRLQGQLRRVQAHGPRALRRAHLRERSSEHLIDIRDDGSSASTCVLRLPRRPAMTNDKFADLFGGPPRKPEDRITQREMDWPARSRSDRGGHAQARALRTRARRPGEAHLCLAGGVALNCVANGEIIRERPSRTSGSSPPPATRAGRWARRSTRGHRAPRQAARSADGRARQCAALPRAGSRRADQGVPRRQGCPYEAPRRDDARRDHRRALAKRRSSASARAAWSSGPARARRPLDHRRRRAARRCSRIMNLKIKFRERASAPSRPRARGATRRVVRARPRASPYMLLVAHVQKRAQAARGASPELHRSARAGEPRALGRPRRHARRPLRAHPDGDAERTRASTALSPPSPSAPAAGCS
jgi:hypothetical protein